MAWVNFPVYAFIIFSLWTIGLLGVYFIKNNKQRIIFEGISLLGVLVLASFILQLWLNLERPPLRTLGETRLWYSFFLPIIGFITYYRWKYKWFLAYALILSAVFLTINILNPATYDKTLMPALQSSWFIPHVIVYIFAYALLGATSLVAVKGLYDAKVLNKNIDESIRLADNLVYLGVSFLTLGLLFGALWAKEAWGHYWTWDPKETWALLTWLSYLIYLHYRLKHREKNIQALWLLTFAFVILLLAWFGVNYLPSTQNSVHTYSKTS